MYDVIPFEKEHLFGAELHGSVILSADLEDYAALEENGNGRTITFNGEPICCLGWDEIWYNRSMGYAIMFGNSGAHMVAITRQAKRMIKECPSARIEMYVKVGFQQGTKWAQLLGFMPEAVMRKFFPNGDDAILYSLVR